MAGFDDDYKASLNEGASTGASQSFDEQHQQSQQQQPLDISHGDNDWGDLVDQTADRLGVDRGEARGLVMQESRGNYKARSPAGAYGLTQVMPDTWRGMGYTDEQMQDPAIQVEAGLKYYKQQRDRTGNARDAFWAYNAGPGNQMKGRMPKETVGYLDSPYLKPFTGGADGQPPQQEQPQAQEAPQNADTGFDADYQASTQAQPENAPQASTDALVANTGPDADINPQVAANPTPHGYTQEPSLLEDVWHGFSRGTDELLAGGTNLIRSSDAWLNQKLGLGDGTFQPVSPSYFEGGKEEIAPVTLAGKATEAITPFAIGTAIGEPELGIADSATGMIPRAAGWTANTAVRQLPSNFTGAVANTPENPNDIATDTATNTAVGVGTEGVLSTVGKVVKPGNAATRTRIQEQQATARNAREAYKDYMEEPSASWYFDGDTATVEEVKAAERDYAEHLESQIPDIDPKAFLESLAKGAQRSKFKVVAPDMSKFKPEDIGMGKTAWTISKLGGMAEKFIPGAHIVRSVAEMPKPGANRTNMALYDVLLAMGVEHLPMAAKSVFVTVPMAAMKQIVDHSHLRDIRRAVGDETLRGDVSRQATGNFLKTTAPTAARATTGFTQYGGNNE